MYVLDQCYLQDNETTFRKTFKVSMRLFIEETTIHNKKTNPSAYINVNR